MNFDYQKTCSVWDSWSSIPEHYNLGVDLTAQQVRAGLGTHVALHWENALGDRRTITYTELDDLSTRFAQALERLGVQRCDRVFLRMPNVPEFYIAALGIAKSGAVFIPSSTQFRAAEIQYRLQDSGAVAVITTSDLLDAVEEAASPCRELRHLIVVRYPDRDLSAPGYLDFEQLLAPVHAAWAPADTRHDDLAFIAYTSGTTGDPKGVAHYQRYPHAYDSLVHFWHDYRPPDIVACPSELGWLLPVASTFLFALSRGLSVVLYDSLGAKFDPLTWLQLIEKYRVTNFTAPPTVYRMMMTQRDRRGAFDLSCWRHAVAAGEPLPADTYHQIDEAFSVAALDGIGMSECMVYCCNMVGLPVRPGSCGRPLPGNEIALLDEQLTPVPAGHDGILCLRRDSHPGMMKEYWNKPSATNEIFQGPWYVSGDVLQQDEDGYFWFRGRADDVINASGYRISPFEIESCLCSHPAVLEAAAVAAPDALRGTIVKAFVILRDGFRANDQLVVELQQYVKQQIAPYKYPREIVLVTSLPKTTSGKIQRRLLRGGAAAAVEK